jgi:hypothetical protein
MYNTYNTGYGVGMPRRVVYQQPIIVANPYMPVNNNYQQPYQQNYSSSRPASSRPEVPVNAVEGILIENDYEPEQGDPVVIEQAQFRG